MTFRKPQTTAFTVREETTLLPFILHALDGISRSRAKAILTGGGVRVDNAAVTRFDHPLHPGQRVEISRHKPAEGLRSRFLRLVYEDDALLVVDKAPGILSMAAPHHAFCVKTVLDDYLRRSRQRCTAHVVHRLDRDTSGLLLYAKSRQTEQVLEHHWHELVTDRRYACLVAGRMQPPEGTVRSWLKDNKAFVTFSSPTDNGGKLAITHYRTLRADDNHSLVECRLETGRKNQIRVHMLDLGHPVCGDPKYGHADNPAGRLCLHAFRLHFFHPLTGEPMRFETPIPASFTAVFNV